MDEEQDTAWVDVLDVGFGVARMIKEDSLTF